METVTQCVKIKDWTKDGKSIPIYKVDLSDGRSGESFGKEIPNGTPIDQLELNDGQHGLKIKWNNPAKPIGGGFASKRGGNESFALSYAKDIYIECQDKIPPMNIDQMFQVAEKMLTWLDSRKK